MKKLLAIILFLVFSSSFVLPNISFAAPVKNDVSGIYTDDFANNTGFPTRSYVNVNAGVLQLTNTSNQSSFATPYRTSGTATSAQIVPLSLALLGSITFDVTIPENTTFKIQLCDIGGNAIPDSVLPGNVAGFTSSPIDLSNVTPYFIGTNYEQARYKIKVTMTTSNTNATPTLDNLKLTWTPKQGDLSPTTFSPTDWRGGAVDQQFTFRKSTSNTEGYVTPKWVIEHLADYWAGPDNLFVYDGKLIANNWAYFGTDLTKTGYLRAYNRNTGEVIWTTPEKLRGGMVIGNNGTGYQVESTHDVLTATDLSNGTYKWSYNFNGGHESFNTIIGNDGTLYVAKQGTSNDGVIYAISSDGRLQWTKNIKLGDVYPPHNLVISPDGNTLYFSYSDSWWRGSIYALDLTDKGNIKWSYEVGDIQSRAIGSDGVIYLGSRYYTRTSEVIIRDMVTALNPDGTLKWQQIYDDANDSNYSGVTSIAIRSDNVLLFTKYSDWNTNFDATGYITYNTVKAISTVDGSVIWNKPMLNGGVSLIDGNNYFYTGAMEAGATNNDWTATLGYYNTAGTNKWKIVYPFTKADDTHTILYKFGQYIADDRGWFYGSFLKKRYIYDAVGETYTDRDSTNSFAKTFALAPWTLTHTKSASVQNIGSDITFTATTSMLQTNPLLGGTNKVQVYIDNGDKVLLTYDSTDGNGNTVWTGTYTIPESLTSGSHTYTVEAAQTYMQTDVTTHFASAPTESNNTGRTSSGTFTVLGDNEQQVSESVTINSTQKQVSIVSDTNTTIAIPSTVTDASISVQPISTDNGTNVTATLPQITINATTSLTTDPIVVSIPDDTVVTATTGWNGIINVPQIQLNSSITPPSIDNLTSTVLSVIEIGSNTTPLTFSKAVRILIPNQATSNNIKVAYIKDNISHEITTTCSSDSQAAGDALPSGGDCKLVVGNDIVVWTKHFNKFVTYTNQTTSSAGSYSAPATVTTTTKPVAKTNLADLMVLLTSLINQYQQIKGSVPKEWEKFVSPTISNISLITQDLYLGISHSDVKILQQFLIDQNIGKHSQALKQFGTTNFFGTLTKNALIEYQQHHNIKPASGYFGIITRNFVKGR